MQLQRGADGADAPAARSPQRIALEFPLLSHSPPNLRVHACLCAPVNVVGKLQDGTVFLDYPVEELDFTLGQGA